MHASTRADDGDFWDERVMSVAAPDPSPSRPPSVAFRRITGAVTALLLAVAAIYFGIGAWQFHSRMRAQEAARPVDMSVELARAGITEVPVVMGIPTLHGLTLHVTSDGAARDWQAALEGFSGQIEFVDPATGATAATVDLPAEHLDIDAKPGTSAMIAFARLQEGRYTARLTVDTPAPALAGETLRLEARNEFCAAESVAAVIGKLATGITGGLALLIGGVTALSVRRYGWRTPCP